MLEQVGGLRIHLEWDLLVEEVRIEEVMTHVHNRITNDYEVEGRHLCSRQL